MESKVESRRYYVTSAIEWGKGREEETILCFLSLSLSPFAFCLHGLLQKQHQLSHPISLLSFSAIFFFIILSLSAAPFQKPPGHHLLFHRLRAFSFHHRQLSPPSLLLLLFLL